MICEKKKCTGCFACYNICPQDAIVMQEDRCGYMYPVINSNICVNCGLCKRICPNNTVIEKKYPIMCYAAKSKDSEVLLKSTSGGIATCLTKLFLKGNNVVYGASYNNCFEVEHTRISRNDDVEKIQGSKYAQSNINLSYRRVKEDLKNGKKVLFVGTPCQIAGLKSFIKKGHDRLYLVDIVCHGVPSNKFLKDELIRLCDISKILNVKYRKGNEYSFTIYKNDGTIMEYNKDESPYLDAFFERISLRESCYSCNYARPERISDMTLGDFWGLTDKSFFNSEEHISLILINSEKGKELFNMVKGEIDYQIRDVDEAINGNSQLKKPSVKHEKADRFKQIYPKKGFYRAYKKVSFIKRYKKRIKNIIKGLIG